MEKYLSLGKEESFAAGEVDEFLADIERSGQYCLNLAYSKSPGNTLDDPNQLPLYGAVFVGGIVLKFALDALSIQLQGHPLNGI